MWIRERVDNGPAAGRVTDQAPLFCRVVAADGTAQHPLDT